MNKQSISFAVVTSCDAVQQVGKSLIYQPKPCFNGGSVKWFDDSKLLKKKPYSIADQSREQGNPIK